MKKGLLILICLPMIGFGQSWERFISLSDSNSYFSSHGEQTIDEGFIVTGWVCSPKDNSGHSDSCNTFLLKIDLQGDTVWSKIYPNLNGAKSTSGGIVKQTLDSGFIVSAMEERYIDSVSYPLIIKTNSYGDTLWTRYFDWISYGPGGNSIGFSFFWDIKQTTDGGFILGLPSHLIKTDWQGDILWTKTCEVLSPSGRSISQTTDGGYIFVSNKMTFDTITFSFTQESYLTKLDSQGDTLWKKTFNTDSIVSAVSVEQTTDGGYIIMGNSSNGIDYSDYITYLTKTDFLGNILWTKTYPYYYIAFGSSAQQTNDDGYIISIGNVIVDTISYGSNIVLLKTNNLGDTIWTKQIEVGDSLESVGHIEQTLDGGYFLVAHIESHQTKESGRGIIYLIKTDENGNITSTFNIPTPNISQGKLLKIVDMLGRKTKGKTNEPLLYIYDNGRVEKKIVIE